MYPNYVVTVLKLPTPPQTHTNSAPTFILWVLCSRYVLVVLAVRRQAAGALGGGGEGVGEGPGESRGAGRDHRESLGEGNWSLQE